jgi:tungstate transport system substrate-binding protein
VGDSMGKTLTVGNEMGGYVFTDKATYLAHDNNLSLLLEETEDMKNTYSLIAISPQRSQTPTTKVHKLSSSG